MRQGAAAFWRSPVTAFGFNFPTDVPSDAGLAPRGQSGFGQNIVKIIATFCLLLALLTHQALAQSDPFELEVDPYPTIGRNAVELESLNSVIPNGHHVGGLGTSAGDLPSNLMYRTAFEFNYGLTDQIEAGAQLNLARANGGSLQYAGSDYRLRGSTFKPGELPLDLGWRVELEWRRKPEFDESQLDLELIPIIAKNIGRFEIDLNPVFEKAIFIGPNKNKGFSFLYAAGLYYHYEEWLSPGLEFYGAIGPLHSLDPLRAQQHYIFPVVRGELPGDIEYNLGPGIGLTRGSDRIITKVSIELKGLVSELWQAFQS